MFKPFFSACILATLIFFSDASIPVTFAPRVAMGSLTRPQPHPISRISKFFKGVALDAFIPNFL